MIPGIGAASGLLSGHESFEVIRLDGGEVNTSSLTTYTFGPYSVTKSGLLVASIARSGGNSRSVSGVTIGGGSATLIGNTAGAAVHAILARRSVSPGDHSVALTLDGSSGAGVVTAAIYLIVGLDSEAPVGSDLDVAGPGTSMSLDFDTPDEGVAFFALASWTDISSANWSFSSAVTDNSAYNSTPFHTRGYNARIEPTTLQSPHTESATGPQSLAAMTGASWR